MSVKGREEAIGTAAVEEIRIRLMRIKLGKGVRNPPQRDKRKKLEELGTREVVMPNKFSKREPAVMWHCLQKRPEMRRIDKVSTGAKDSFGGTNRVAGIADGDKFEVVHAHADHDAGKARIPEFAVQPAGLLEVTADEGIGFEIFNRDSVFPGL